MICLHRWSKWGEPTSLTYLIWTDGTINKKIYQSKTCKRCKKVKMRPCW